VYLEYGKLGEYSTVFHHVQISEFAILAYSEYIPYTLQMSPGDLPNASMLIGKILVNLKF
jgi:hypothetical protein